ncbi:DUF2510 domain-containing protein [Microbacterium sp. BWT-B31]|uniref:DUF2510 domain-containing protein n=1 Tax=Microbacterium sp. BWT-B31 TaxID=3232072 RepID=UPI003526FCD0
MTTTTPPGWYDDGHGALRWWDGTTWTEHAQPLQAPVRAADDSFDAAPAAPTGRPIIEDVQVVESLDQLEAAAATAAAAPAALDSAAPGPTQPQAPAYPGVPAPDGFAGGAPGQPYPVAASAAPGAYPLGYPTGQGAPTGGFISATDPKKSKAWIVWLVVGIVLLVLIAVAAVLIPLSLMFNARSNAQAAAEGERAAVAAVELYDEAWQTSDCVKFQAATTEALRTSFAFETCEAFEGAADDFAATVEGYELTVTAIEHSGEQIVIATTEAYDSLIDQSGPVPIEDHYRYTLISDGSGWLIDDITTE